MHLFVLKGPSAGTVFPLNPGDNTAGRSADNAIHLQSAHASTRHCSFVVENGQVVVRDRGSTNGVYVEGKRVTEAILRHGSRVQIGDWLMALDLHTAPGQPAQPPPELSYSQPNMPAAPAPAPQQYQGYPQQPAAPFGGPAQGYAQPAPAYPPQAGPSGFGAPQQPAQPYGAFGSPNVAQAFGSEEPQRPPEPAPAQQAASYGAPASGFGAPASGFGAPASGFGAPASGFGAPAASRPAPASGFGVKSDDSVLGFGEIGPQSGQEHMAVGENEDWVVRSKGMWRRIRSFPWIMQLAGIMIVLLLFLFGGSFVQAWHARSVAQDQIIETGKALAYALAQRNVGPIAESNNLKLEADFIRGEKGVRQSMVVDNQGVARAPAESVGRSLAKQEFFSEANTVGQPSVSKKGAGEYHILSPIRVRVVEDGPINTAGWAYIVYDVGEITSEKAPFVPRLVGGLVVLLIGIGACGIAVWRLSNAPVAGLREELELVMRGHVASVAVPSEWKNLRELAHSINRLIARWKKGDNASSSDLRAKTAALVEGLQVPVFLTDGELRIFHTSDATLQWLGCARESLVGRPIGEVLPDRALVDALLAACGRVSRKEANIVADTSRVGGNRVRLVVTDAGSEGVLAVISVG